MNRTLISIAISMAMGLSIAACSSDSDDGNDTGNTDAGAGGETGSSTGGDTGGGTGGDTGGNTDSGTGGGGSSNFQLNGMSVSISGEVSQWGVVSVDEDASSQEVIAGGTFFSINQMLPFGDIASALGSEELDVCTVTEFETGGDFEADLDLAQSILDSITNVSAGQTITLSSSAGTYGTLQETTAFGFTYYEPQAELTLPTPEVIEVSVPGDVFPAMTLSTAKPAVISDFSPGYFSEITGETEFTWTVGEGSSGTLEISIGSGFGASGGAFADCIVENDGSFVLPASTLTELTAITGDATLNLQGVDSFSFNIAQSGSSILMFTRSAEVGFATP